MGNDIYMYILIFAISLFLGSFYNVVALRTLKNEKLSFPPSHCANCNHRLSPLDLFPVLSYLFLGGKCRYCKEKISLLYPFGELFTAISYTIIFWKYGLTLEAFIHVVFITIMIIATIADLKEHIVPDRFVVVGLVVVLILRIIDGTNLLNYIISAVVSFGVLFLILILSNGRMGGADVKLYALIGLAIGMNNSVCSLFYASFVALIINFGMLLRKKEQRVEIPFVPYITVGILATYVVNIYSLPIF